MSLYTLRVHFDKSERHRSEERFSSIKRWKDGSILGVSARLCWCCAFIGRWGREQVKCEEDGRILIIGCDTNPIMTRTRLMLLRAGMMRCVVQRIIQVYELGCYEPLTQLLAAETCI